MKPALTITGVFLIAVGAAWPAFLAFEIVFLLNLREFARRVVE